MVFGFAINPQKAYINNIDSPETILAAIATIAGTILAVAFRLSIIPIQRASKTWSSAILRIYRERIRP